MAIDKHPGLLEKFYTLCNAFMASDNKMNYQYAISNALGAFVEEERHALERYIYLRLREVDPGHWNA